ncbi:MAG: glycosyltransferase [Planctomycetota bacterium]
MRLVVNATAYGDPPGGAGLRARHLYGALRGHRLLFCIAADTPPDLVPPGAEVRRLPVRAAHRWRRLLRLRLPEEGDLLLTDHYPVGRIPTLITLHDLGGSRPRRAWIRRNARRAAGVVAVSRAVARAFGVEATVVPGGFQPPAEPPRSDSGGEPYLLFSDPALRHKNAPVARHAARRVGLALREVGRGARWLDRNDMNAAVAGARAVLCPSLGEGFGLVALEAMALGVPVAASDLPAHREVLGEVGFYAPPGDAAAFAVAVEQALACGPGRRERGRERARAFTWQRAAERLEEAIARAGERRASG